MSASGKRLLKWDWRSLTTGRGGSNPPSDNSAQHMKDPRNPLLRTVRVICNHSQPSSSAQDRGPLLCNLALQSFVVASAG
jgi:hypothetical protein